MDPSHRPNPEPPFSAAPRDLSRVFLGPHGLRAGWGLLLFVFICLIVSAVTGFLLLPVLHWNPGQPLSPRAGVILEIVQFVPVLVATLFLAFIQHRPPLSFGFEGHARALRFVSGLVCGFVALSVLVFALSKLGFLALHSGSLAPAAALKDAALWAFIFLLGGFFEESFLRGYPQFTLTRGIGFWWSALLLSITFAALHRANSGESIPGLIAVAAVGLVFCLSLWYTGSLWWAVGFHAAWDWGQSCFYGTPDSGVVSQGHLLNAQSLGPVLWSGGADGPEASLLIFPLLALIAAIMVLWWGRRVRSPFAGSAWRPAKPPLPGEQAPQQPPLPLTAKP